MSRTMQTVLALLLGIAAAPAAAAGDGVLTPEHVARLRAVASVAISPDGGLVAYTLFVPRVPREDENGPAWVELHVVDREGRARPFVTGEVDVGAVDWTPDGTGISFLAKRGSDEQRCLYVISRSGGEARRVLAHETAISAYSWSPDGARVAFLAAEKPDPEREKLAKKGFDAQVFEEVFDPVRAWIAALGGEESAPRRLDLEGSASELHWSPAGDCLAVALAPTPSSDDAYMNRKVHIVDAESGAVLLCIDTPGKIGQAAFSPDGAHLALISAADRNDPQEGRLTVTDLASGATRDLIPDLMGHVTSVAWKDGEVLAFLADQGTSTSLEEIGRDGANRNAIIPAGRAVMSGLSLARDGAAGAVRSDGPQHPAEVYAMSRGARGGRRLTNSNPWLDELRLAPQEVVRYAARDGLELEGILIHPLDEEPGRRYPLIVSVHGGPEAHCANGWLTRYADPGQAAAARGFAVFNPNYRGSTGRGVAFSKMGQADYCGAEFDDVIDAVDHLVGIGLADPERVGITGGSYGGLATAWCCTRYSERFAAGVMFVGISDQISKFGGTDVPQEMLLVHARKNPWDDWRFFLERSPIFHAQQARTPLLILGGTEDTRVDPSQSLEMHRYLKAHGQAPVRLVRYPGEGHGNRKAAARYDCSLRLLGWFEHYLKGQGGDPPPHRLEYGFQEEEEDESR
ncbi:MAG: S9 family peptidase [Planctomycetes bacterium]|nr:S9 family peptidase [Planctomycetota bacterium]